MTYSVKVNVNCFYTSELFIIQSLPQLQRCGTTDKMGNELQLGNRWSSLVLQPTEITDLLFSLADRVLPMAEESGPEIEQV